MRSLLNVFTIVAAALAMMAAPSEAIRVDGSSSSSAKKSSSSSSRDLSPGGLLDEINSIDNNWNFLMPKRNNPIVPNLGSDVNGGAGCAVCTLLIGLLEQVAQIHNQTIDKAIGDFCAKIDPKIGGECKTFFHEFGPAIIKAVEDGFTGDEVCNMIKICKSTDGEVCRLFPPSHVPHLSEIAHQIRLKKATEEIRKLLPPQAILEERLRSFNICTIAPGVCRMIHHEPLWDADGDHFAPAESKTLRGSYWRGADCNDSDASVHVGRDSSDATVDSNCNGIYGVDPTDGVAYEDKWCKNTGAQGVAILGDSATAHFAIPPGWVTAADASWEDYSGILRDAEDELDWPMLSWSTGHMNASEFKPDGAEPGLAGPTDSIYLRHKEANLCNNMDFQNIGVNGARSGKLKGFANYLGRTMLSDKDHPQKPMQLFMAMIGNDVCNGHHTYETMTPVAEYKQNVKEAVLYVDTFLPKGSSVVLVGLADGRVLWDAMHDRIHPIGSTNNDVTYKDVYDYLNCLHINPCWGWLNSNATIRNYTSHHAAALSDTLPEIVEEVTPVLNNTKVVYINNWITAIKDAPYPKWQLIEPVDGFHPSQLGNALLAKYFYNQTLQLGVAPQVNPNNAAIKAKFGL